MGEVAALVPQQIGRARAELQYRLAEATRKLVRSIGARYAESTFRLESALRTAAVARESTTETAARLDHELVILRLHRTRPASCLPARRR